MSAIANGDAKIASGAAEVAAPMAVGSDVPAAEAVPGRRTEDASDAAPEVAADPIPAPVLGPGKGKGIGNEDAHAHLLRTWSVWTRILPILFASFCFCMLRKSVSERNWIKRASIFFTSDDRFSKSLLLV